MKQTKQIKQMMMKLKPVKEFLNTNKKVITAVLVVFLIGTLLGMVSEAKEISGKFVRFHIVANSDSIEDQTVKLKVREAIFEELDFSHITSKEEAISYFSEHQEKIKSIANRVLLENGFTYSANISVGKKEFPIREYSNFVLPAGTYDAVSITLGEGNGQNFFCVMYPSLCKIEGVTESTTADFQVLNNVLTEKEVATITGNKTNIVYKFKIVELLDKIF